jgi:hypothetical protein
MFGPASADFKKAIQTAHQRGLRMIQYTIWPGIGAPSALADQFASEWEVKPVSLLPIPPPEGHYDINASLSARGYADYYAAGSARLMDELGVDGIYNDGIAQVYPSENLYARAGYVDESGSLHPTVPIFGCRECVKRLWRIVMERKPNGVIYSHCSFNMILPIMSFSSIYMIGEHENYENLLETRLRFSSRPWGLQAALIGTDDHVYNSLYKTVGLLLGTGEFGYNLTGRNGYGRKFINLRKAYLAYGYKSAEWVPYFKNRDKYYTTGDPQVKSSLYYHSGKDIFLVVGNMEGLAKTATLQLNPKAFGLEGAALRARNALTQVPIALAQDGKLSVFVRAKSFTLVAVEPNP